MVKHDWFLRRIIIRFVGLAFAIVFSVVFMLIQSLPTWLGVIVLALVILYILSIIGSKLMEMYIGDDGEDG